MNEFQYVFLVCVLELLGFPIVNHAVDELFRHGEFGGPRVLGVVRHIFDAGVIGLSIMFQGIQSVAMPLSAEFGFTREIEDRVQAPCPVSLVALAKVFSQTAVDIEPDGSDKCIVTTGADDPERMVLYLGMPGYEFEVLSPPEVIEAVRAVADRLSRAVAPM